jgi:hypothetical protein
MDLGKVEYMVDGVNLKLTLVGLEDLEILKSEGLAGLRRKRLMRLSNEAVSQGAMLGYDDLCCLLVSSLSTLKRDVSIIEEAGISVPLKGRRMRTSSQADGMVKGA